ncbi:MAG: lysophospholipid acyltransferase family protein [Gammaproteobacteria bacterium]
MRALASLTTYVAVILGTVVLASLAVLLAWLPPRGSAVLFFARLWAHVVLAGAWVRLEVEVDPALDPRRGYVFLANHGSYLDVPVLLAALPVPVRFAAKKDLFRIPFFGWAIRAGGFIPVDREQRRQAIEVFSAAAALLRAGASVAFFPEGTRSPDGRLHRFQRGGFLVAQKCGAAIVPVGLAGTFEVLPRQRWSVRPGRVRVRVGAPIETTGYPVSRKDELIARVRDQIALLSS